MKEPSNKAERKSVLGKRIILIIVLTLVACSMLISGAWYVIKTNRKIESEITDVMTPYFLYLLNPGDETSLSVSIGNIHPGEIKQMVVAVSSKEGTGGSTFEIAKDNNFDYQLELAYTENLPVEYKIYELSADEGGDVVVYDEYGSAVKKFSKKSSVYLASEDVSEARIKEMYGTETTGIVNLGKYELFEKDSDNKKLNLVSTLDSLGVVSYDMDYYLIEIKWQAGKSFAEYAKETDLVYLIVKALQPKPQEK